MNIAEITELLRQSLAVLVPELDTSPSAPIAQYLAAVAGVNAALFQRLDILERDAIPTTATFQGALKWGKALGVPRKGPTAARGVQALQVQGTPGAAVPDGAELRARSTGLRVAIAGSYTVGPAGTVLADVITLDTGQSANLPVDTVLRFVATPAGLQEQAKTVKSLAGAVDREPEGAYQARVADRLANPPQGGNFADYRTWIVEALPDVLLTGYPLARRNGRGTVDVVGLRDGTGAYRSLTPAERGQILTHIEARKLATDQVRVVETVPVVVDIELAITPVADRRFAFDFRDHGGLEVAAWDPVTRALVFTADLPSDVAPKHRISLQAAGGGASGSTGAEQTIAAIVGPNAITLVDNPDRPVPALAPGDKAYAGGPLVDLARHAILAGYTVGCDAGAVHIPGIDQLGPANPDTRYGIWLDRVEPSRLEAAARAQPGVDTAVAIAPTAAIVPTDPAANGPPPPSESQTIEVLVAGEVIIRRA